MSIDRSVQVTAIVTYSASTAEAVLTVNISAMAALTGFVVTVAVLAVQMATGTFSARYMRLWYRNWMLKGLLASLVGTLSYSYTTVRFVEDDFVPNLTVTLSAVAVLVGLLWFVIFFDRVLHDLRPVAVASHVADQASRSFEAWMRVIHDPATRVRARGPGSVAEATDLIVRARRPGCIQALDIRGLTRFAKAQGCHLVVHHAIGDFVPRDAVLLSAYGGSLPARAAGRLGSMVALGDERTIEQDPMFAVRIMVDIANKALSPAVNDPTTAIQVLDHLAETLRLIGTAKLPESGGPPGDGDGYGVSLPLRGWDEFLELGVTEIREYGAESVQVMRRLRALLLQLEELVPAERQPSVRDQLRRLDATAERSFGGTEDRDLALDSDAQGIGGPTRTPGG